MKRIVLLASVFLIITKVQSQTLLYENFDVFPTPNWVSTNQSSPIGPTTWQQGPNNTTFGGAFNGLPTSFIVASFNSVTGTGTISNWYISPVVNLQNGDEISFYTRKGGTSSTFADRLELRLSTNGNTTVNPTGSTGLGDFTTLALTVNPNQNLTDYPFTWTRFTYIVSGLPSATDCKVAFRYYVTNTNVNGSVIGIDAFAVNRTLGTDAFFKSNFEVYPNPASSVLNINSKNNSTFNQVQITDLNGRIIKNINTKEITSTQINISDLKTGVYFLKVASDDGVGTTKIIKN